MESFNLSDVSATLVFFVGVASFVIIKSGRHVLRYMFNGITASLLQRSNDFLVEVWHIRVL